MMRVEVQVYQRVRTVQLENIAIRWGKLTANSVQLESTTISMVKAAARTVELESTTVKKGLFLRLIASHAIKGFILVQGRVHVFPVLPGMVTLMGGKRSARCVQLAGIVVRLGVSVRSVGMDNIRVVIIRFIVSCVEWDSTTI